ncbi:hypothetical protein [Rhizobium gallicum]|uniref:hypothetical protein n=1 Tax=Rhizobium gallicum TaxID=56730 RepID=UPI00037C595D
MADDHKSIIEDFIARFITGCMDEPLYGRVSIPPKPASNPVDRLFEKALQFDGYCIQCERDSVFRVAESMEVENSVNVSSQFFPDNQLSFFKTTFHCQREPHHTYVYFWRYIRTHMVKVGQSPSLETIASNDVKQYKGILGKEYFGELHRATGLAWRRDWVIRLPTPHFREADPDPPRDV